MNWHLEVEALEKMSIEELKELEDKLWEERKKVVTIIEYKKLQGGDK